ncbi:ISL3 family transposase [Dankookia rubra]|uniref:ISL3 family transposase n=1 Tax=Dankookia rubra TaxID=1442381 RepID=UPI0014086370|nr:ISL3 family transposase [Dankookia rubra]
MTKHLLSLIPAGLLVQQILPSPELLTIVVAPREPWAACPACDKPSWRVHSRYDRILNDLPWQGQPVRLRVQARRFRCVEPECPRLTFAERLANSAPPAARRTGRLDDLQRHLGLAAGGEVGSRLAARLAMPVSADTLLRMARRTGAAPQSRSLVRVLAVDEWAWRRGRRYGTVLADLERDRVVDLLPDRSAESLAAWLKANPGIAVVARDRAGVYADGVRQGAPDAVEVTDRWHLLRNLGDAVHAAAERHHAGARRIAREVMQQPGVPSSSPAAVGARPGAAWRPSAAARARRQGRFEEAARLHAAGASLSAISRQLGADRKTLRQWLRAGAMPFWRQPRRGSVLDPYCDHLERRWTEGRHNAARLWRELAALGFSGRDAIVRSWATERRRTERNRTRAPRTADGKPWRPPSGRRVARLLMAVSRTLSRPDRTSVAKLLEEVPALAATAAAAKRLEGVLRKKNDETQADVLAVAERTHLSNFVAELRKDITACPASGSMRHLRRVEKRRISGSP